MTHRRPTDCRAALAVGDNAYPCDMQPAHHPGLAHRNKEIQAYWCSDAEARRHPPKAVNGAPAKTVRQPKRGR
jgi:hypothetical protein